MHCTAFVISVGFVLTYAFFPVVEPCWGFSDQWSSIQFSVQSTNQDLQHLVPAALSAVFPSFKIANPPMLSAVFVYSGTLRTCLRWPSLKKFEPAPHPTEWNGETRERLWLSWLIAFLLSRQASTLCLRHLFFIFTWRKRNIWYTRIHMFYGVLWKDFSSILHDTVPQTTIKLGCSQGLPH